MIAALQRLTAAATGVLAVATLASCTDATPQADPYTYDPHKAAVDVDTPQLRQQKVSAGIRDCPESTAGASQRDHGLPAITLPCLGGGRAVDLAGLTGEPTVLNFWAQTCAPCRQEAPLFERLYDAAKGVRVVGVDFYDPLPGRAIAFADELGLTYPQVADPEAVTRAPLHVSGLPMTVFLGADGSVRHVEYGAVRSADDLATLVSAHLDVDVDLR